MNTEAEDLGYLLLEEKTIETLAWSLFGEPTLDLHVQTTNGAITMNPKKVSTNSVYEGRWLLALPLFILVCATAVGFAAG